MSRNRVLLSVAIGMGIIGYASFRSLAGPSHTSQAEVVSPAVPTSLLVGLGRIESGDGVVYAASEVDGTVSRVLVRVGDQVAAGAVLVELKDAVLREEAAALRVRADVQQRRVATYQAAQRAAITRRDRAERTFARLREVATVGDISDEQLDSAETSLLLARIDVQKAMSDVDVARAEAQAALRDVATTEARVAQRVLRAPLASQVLRLDVQPGEAISASREVVELAPRGPQVVRCELDELVADEVSLGASGVVRALAGHSAWATGRITRVSPALTRKSLFADVAGEAEDRRVREVRLQLDGVTNLPLNARVECAIERVRTTSRGEG